MTFCYYALFCSCNGYYDSKRKPVGYGPVYSYKKLTVICTNAMVLCRILFYNEIIYLICKCYNESKNTAERKLESKYTL